MINSFKILDIEIHFYSLFILLGILVAYILITKEAKKRGISDKDITNIIFYTVIIGIIGARIYYVLFNLDYYSSNIKEIFMVWNGGLAIHGGIIFGMIFLYFYTKKLGINYLKMVDIAVPGLIIAQAIGRWGNFFNQEAYGSVISKSVLEKLFVPKFIIDGMYINNEYHLPAFYIESILCLIGFIVIMIVRKKINIKVGSLTAIYLIWYGLIRFFIESFRTDSLMFGFIKQAQIVSILFIIIGIIIIANRKRRFYKE